MRKYSLLIYLLIATATLFSCYSDDSKQAFMDIDELALSIEPFETSYTALSDNGERLQIAPVVKGNYDSSDLEYHWYVYEASKESSFVNDEGKCYEATLISEERDLDYPVDLTVGQYTIMLRVSARSNGCAAYQSTALQVTTRYAEGFYILKEVDGATELDFLASNDEKTENLFTRLHQAPLAGTPTHLSVVYNHAYIDNETHKPANSHALCITTRDNKIRFLRSSDLAIVHDEKSMFYAADGVDELPYTTVNTVFKSVYLSSKGAYITECGGGVSKPEPIGKFGNPESPAGASPFVVKTGAYGTAFWNEQTHSIYEINMNGGLVTATTSNNIPVTNLTDYECIFAGWTYINWASKLYFLFDNTADGTKVLYRMTADWSSIRPDSKLVVPAQLHFSKASYRSYNTREASIAYCVDEGKLYAYSLVSENGTEENEIVPQGIPQGENIVYAENIYWVQNNNYGTDFNYLVVGTQTGDTYTLYMYKTLGGYPDGAPVRTVSGTGQLKRAVFLASNYPPSNAGLYLGYSY